MGLQSWLWELPPGSRIANASRVAYGLWSRARWRLRGRPTPPPYAEKRAAIRRASRQWNLPILVETGTYRGDTVAASSRSFEKIVSIELDQRWADQAQRRFEGESHIEVLHGDSAEILPRVVRALQRRTLFWLDGHWSGPMTRTAKGPDVTPVLDELRTVLDSDLNHVVLIDDARLFGLEAGYPDLDDVAELIRDVAGDYDLWVKDDIIYVVNQQCH